LRRADATLEIACGARLDDVNTACPGVAGRDASIERSWLSRDWAAGHIGTRAIDVAFDLENGAGSLLERLAIGGWAGNGSRGGR
jgi:hypothetical protein